MTPELNEFNEEQLQKERNLLYSLPIEELRARTLAVESQLKRGFLRTKLDDILFEIYRSKLFKQFPEPSEEPLTPTYEELRQAEIKRMNKRLKELDEAKREARDSIPN
jgi:hypothetical protein